MPSPSGSVTGEADPVDLKDLTPRELESFLTSLGKERFRSRQIMKWMYQAGSLSLDEMTNLSKEFRKSLASIARISSLAPEKIQISADGTKKALFRLEDGETIESVLIPEKNHWTICLSTQAGCAMGCSFCLTGTAGFRRNLRPSEIVGQLTAFRFHLPEGPYIKNVVMMGMGEPLLNYDNSLKAIDIMTSDVGLGISRRRVTVSTCGIVPMIRRLGTEAGINLAVSLNAPDNATRNTIMPVNRRYPLESLIEACRDYPMPLRRRITMEYILIRDVNDSPDQAKTLLKLLRGVRCKINLIAYNEHPEGSFKTPPQERITAFQDILARNNLTAVVRKSKGQDIMAACGQLRGSL